MITSENHELIWECDTVMDAVGCGLVMFNEELSVIGLNAAAHEFFLNAVPWKGCNFDETSGALRNLAFENGSGTTELLISRILEFEDCTVDYVRCDGKQYRLSANSCENSDIRLLLTIIDISDITESEQMLINQNLILTDRCGNLKSQLRIADALAAEHEKETQKALFSKKLSKILDNLEAAYTDKNHGAFMKEIEEHRNYLSGLQSESNDFIKKLRDCIKDFSGTDNELNVEFNHAGSPNCGAEMQNDIIDVIRESILFIVQCTAPRRINVSIRFHNKDMYYYVHSDKAPAPDFEKLVPYLLFKEAAFKMRAEVRIDTSDGFGLVCSCSQRNKLSPAADKAVFQYNLTPVEETIIEMTGQGYRIKNIAERLHYSQGSVRNMLSAIYVKLGIRDRAQLAVFAIHNGFVSV